MRRRWFAAPLVVIACSGREEAPVGFSLVHRSGDACTISVPEHCPKGVSCNPPPPRSVECPAAMGGADTVTIAERPGGCKLMVPPCRTLKCATDTPCPSKDPIRPLTWAVAPTDDGRCTATSLPRTQFDASGPAQPIDCPPARAGFVDRATTDAPCVACEALPCDRRVATPIACPDAK